MGSASGASSAVRWTVDNYGLVIILTWSESRGEVPVVDGSNVGDISQQLRDHGLQVTAQRIGVMEAVAAHPHATTEELIEAVRAKLGAIYASLNVSLAKDDLAYSLNDTGAKLLVVDEELAPVRLQPVTRPGDGPCRAAECQDHSIKLR